MLINRDKYPISRDRNRSICLVNPPYFFNYGWVVPEEDIVDFMSSVNRDRVNKYFFKELKRKPLGDS